ncbi:hypothetical protein BLOT_006518 [Blomia tropicalis]|nr:hypothetical protein BLOT_006518 [Blomia tropicalis]
MVVDINSNNNNSNVNERKSNGHGIESISNSFKRSSEFNCIPGDLRTKFSILRLNFGSTLSRVSGFMTI